MDEITLDRAMLYGILQKNDPAAYFRAREHGVEPEHVLDEDQKVFEFMGKFIRTGRLPTTTEIKAQTGVSLIVPDVAVEPFDVDVFAGQIQRRALQNAMKDPFGEIATLIVTDPFEARKRMSQLVRETAWSLGKLTSYADPALAQETLGDYERARDNAGELLGLSSPWEDVDAHSLGLQPGELTVLLAKRKVGKTWLMLKWFMHILRSKKDLRPGECLLVVSMEMPKKQIYRRLAAIDLLLNYQGFRSGRLTSEEERRLTDHVKAMMTPDPTRKDIHIACADVVRDVADICDKVAELNPKGVAIDGMYILGRDRRMGMWERTIQNCAEIKLDLCTEMNMPVLATTQFRGTKSKHALEADADDAAYAKAIGDWADAMRGIFMDEEYERAGKRVFRAMESREFRGVDIQISFNLKSMDFKQLKLMDEDKKGEGEGAQPVEDADPDADPTPILSGLPDGTVPEAMVSPVAPETEAADDEDADTDQPADPDGGQPTPSDEEGIVF